MTAHRTGSPDEWPAARLHPLEGDEVAKRRRELPWVRIDKEYPFDTDDGSAALTDPLIGVYHWLDRAPKGRNETGPRFRRHDEYDSK